MTMFNFNIYGLARPTTSAEFKALLSEAVLLAEQLESQIDHMGVLLEAQPKREAV